MGQTVGKRITSEMQRVPMTHDPDAFDVTHDATTDQESPMGRRAIQRAAEANDSLFAHWIVEQAPLFLVKQVANHRNAAEKRELRKGLLTKENGDESETPPSQRPNTRVQPQSTAPVRTNEKSNLIALSESDEE